jgi:radical SAM superfamily enzyme
MISRVLSGAARLVKDRGLNLAVHLIPGLPGEGWEEVRTSVKRVVSLGIDGIKFHNPHIPMGTRMFDEFLRGEVTLPSPERYLEYVIRSLELLDPRTVVMRLTFDAPKHRRGYPGDFWKKTRLYAIMADEMEARNTHQGRLFSPEAP